MNSSTQTYSFMVMITNKTGTLGKSNKVIESNVKVFETLRTDVSTMFGKK